MEIAVGLIYTIILGWALKRTFVFIFHSNRL